VSVARGLLLAFALAGCAWFAVGVRQARDTARAVDAIPPHARLDSASAARAASLLSAAGWLNPDRQVDVLRGQLALDENDPARAERILAQVTKAEPQNLSAWLLMSEATLHRDPPTFALAIRMLTRLDSQLR
jgi:hypothetical protein